jgi:hypothetical protein
LHKVHTSVRGDLRSGGANDSKLEPESSGANRDGVTSDLLALFGATEDINEIDTLASRKRGGSCSKCWETWEARHSVAQRFRHRVDWEDLPASCGECAQDAV